MDEQECVENNKKVMAVPEDFEEGPPDCLRRSSYDDYQGNGDDNTCPSAEKNKYRNYQVDVRGSYWVEVRII